MGVYCLVILKLSFLSIYAQVKLFCPHLPPPEQSWGQRENVCDKKGGTLKKWWLKWAGHGKNK